MSGLSVGKFLEVAHEAKDGKIRMDADTRSYIVNKGTLGSKIGTLVKQGDHSSRNSRAEEALRHFRHALASTFGDANAEMAIEYAFQNNGRKSKDGLTGRVVIEAVERARTQVFMNRHTNLEIFEAQRMDDNDEIGADFNRRFKQSLEARSGYGLFVLEDDAAENLKEEILTQVNTLQNAGSLGDSNKARTAFSDAMQEVLAAIARYDPPDVLLAKLRTAQERWDELNLIEGTYGNEDNREKFEICTLEALRKQAHENPEDQGLHDFIEDLKTHSVSDSSPLRALYSVLDNVTQIGGVKRTPPPAIYTNVQVRIGEKEVQKRTLVVDLTEEQLQNVELTKEEWERVEEWQKLEAARTTEQNDLDDTLTTEQRKLAPALKELCSDIVYSLSRFTWQSHSANRINDILWFSGPSTDLDQRDLARDAVKSGLGPRDDEVEISI